MIRSRSSIRWAVHLAIALALLISPSAARADTPAPEEVPAPEPGTGEQETETLEAVSILLEGLTLEPPAAPQKITAALVRLGAPAVPCLLELRPRFRERVHLDVTVAALRKLDRAKVDVYLLDVVEGSCGQEPEVHAWRELAKQGTAAELPRLLKALDRNQGFVKRSGELALVAILRRESDPRTYQVIGEAVQQGSVETRARILSCVADAGAPEGMSFLADLVGWRPELDLVLVTGITRMPMTRENRGVLLKLRELLESEDSNLRREAVSALGKFRDTESIEPLIELLEGHGKGIAGNADWALRNITGLQFPPDPSRWRQWLATEKEWWELEGQACLAALGSDDEAEVIQAVHLLSRRPLGRERILEPVAALLDSSSDSVRFAAKAVLAKLGFETAEVVAARQSGGSGRSSSPGLPAGGAEIVEEASSLPSSPLPAAPQSAESRPLVVIVGCTVLILLLFSLFGLVAWDWIRDRVGSLTGGRQAG